MTKLIFDRSLDESRKVVAKAFKQTDGIKKYTKSDYQVVGKTGVSFPRILWSYGESVYVDLSETDDPLKTEIEVSAEKEVFVNVGANAQKFKRRFLDELVELRESDKVFDSPVEENTNMRELEEDPSIPEGGKALMVFIIITMFISTIMIGSIIAL